MRWSFLHRQTQRNGARGAEGGAVLEERVQSLKILRSRPQQDLLVTLAQREVLGMACRPSSWNCWEHGTTFLGTDNA